MFHSWNRGIFENVLQFSILHALRKTIWRIINTIAPHFAWKYAWTLILSLDITCMCSSKLTVFLEKTVRFSEQIMSADKYPSIFSRQMEAITYALLGQISKLALGFCRFPRRAGYASVNYHFICYWWWTIQVSLYKKKKKNKGRTYFPVVSIVTDLS